MKRSSFLKIIGISLLAPSALFSTASQIPDFLFNGGGKWVEFEKMHAMLRSKECITARRVLLENFKIRVPEGSLLDLTGPISGREFIIRDAHFIWLKKFPGWNNLDFIPDGGIEVDSDNYLGSPAPL